MKITAAVLLLFVTQFSLADSGVKTIYGKDNRQDLFEVTNPLYRELSLSTAAVMSRTNLAPMTNGQYFIQSTIFGESMEMCKSERFYDQPSAAFCSAFLVTPDLMLTAGHCVFDETDCKSARFVFHYAVTTPGQYPNRANPENIYACKEVVAKKFTFFWADYALVRLDRSVTGIKPLALNRSGFIDPTAEFVVMGHPAGLPLKIADGATLRQNRFWKKYFKTNTDTFGGNSGSPVINTRTGLVEGILVRGGRDYNFSRKENCYRTRVCVEKGCRGEDVTKVSTFLKHLPPAHGLQSTNGNE